MKSQAPLVLAPFILYLLWLWYGVRHDCISKTHGIILSLATITIILLVIGELHGLLE